MWKGKVVCDGEGECCDGEGCDGEGEGCDNNNNYNERISRALFHVKHAQLR